MKEISRRSETKAMVRSLVVLAQELGMKVIVEGVESATQLAIIKEIGANQVQGYLLGRPMPDPRAILCDTSKKQIENTLNSKSVFIAETASIGAAV